MCLVALLDWDMNATGSVWFVLEIHAVPNSQGVPEKDGKHQVQSSPVFLNNQSCLMATKGPTPILIGSW